MKKSLKKLFEEKIKKDRKSLALSMDRQLFRGVIVTDEAKKHINDIYQYRYISHQERKKSQLMSLIDSRSSQRVFNGLEVDKKDVVKIVESLAKVPSSCGRQAIFAKVVEDRTAKELLGALLVGGVGWIHRADKIILLFADPEAYKAGDEIKFMPYLDAGVVVGNAYLICEDMGLGCCFVNPNVREENIQIFESRFLLFAGDVLFCGALAIGRYDEKAKSSPKKESIIVK